MDQQQTDHQNDINKTLEDAKQKALQELVPVIDSISDVSAERKYEIYMSAVRLTDNKHLVPKALDAALGIEDAGAKAEALVELVNEINFLQKN